MLAAGGVAARERLPVGQRQPAARERLPVGQSQLAARERLSVWRQEARADAGASRARETRRSWRGRRRHHAVAAPRGRVWHLALKKTKDGKATIFFEMKGLHRCRKC